MVDVEIFPDEKKATFKSSKRDQTYTLEKDRSGFIFYEFKVEKGQVPEALAGKFSSYDRAKEAFINYHNSISMTASAKYNYHKKLKEEKSAQLHAESSEHVH